MNSGTMKTRGAKTPRRTCGQVRFLFPERLLHLRENAAPAQFIGVLVNGRGGIGVERRAVSGQHQGRV